MKRYFYVTVHFFPKYEKDLFIRLDNGLYKNKENGYLYKKRLLYDFGWGQEEGFELFPKPTFDELIFLVEQPKPNFKKSLLKKYSEDDIKINEIWHNNLYGAVAVIMQDYLEEFVDFLCLKSDTDYFSDSSICNNYKVFSFDTKNTFNEGRFPGGILTQSYEDILNENFKWKTIKHKIINQIYKQESTGDGSVC